MAALVKGLSGSATFRIPAGSWVMRGRISGGGRRCRMLGRRRNLKQRSCAVRAAMAEGGEIEDAIAERLVNDVVRSKEVQRRIKSASPGERAKVAEEITAFVRELQEQGFAPPSALTPQVPDLMNVEPQTFGAMLQAAAATVRDKADKALDAAAGDTDPPSQSDLAAWVAQCPHYVLTEEEKRLAIMWRLKPKQVRVTGWAFGGLVTWRDGVEFHVPAAELGAESLRRKIPNPPQAGFREFLLKPSLFVMRRSEDRPEIAWPCRT